MEFRIIYLPSFKAAVSEVSKEPDFSSEGALGRFNTYFSAVSHLLDERDKFSPRDFLYFDEKKGGLRWMWALIEGMDDGGNNTFDFDGGYYLTFAHKDGDGDANGRLYNGAMEYIENSDLFELDVRANHYAMGHIITPQEIFDAQGWGQMETFIPIKLKD